MSTPRIPNRLDGAQRIAEEIGAAIVAGRYAPDTLVPGEIELGRRYGASRTVVREALKLLSAKGLIASRKRSGTRARPQHSSGGHISTVSAHSPRRSHTPRAGAVSRTGQTANTSYAGAVSSASTSGSSPPST